jgi:hypothetical protein
MLSPGAPAVGVVLQQRLKPVHGVSEAGLGRVAGLELLPQPRSFEP